MSKLYHSKRIQRADCVDIYSMFVAYRIGIWSWYGWLSLLLALYFLLSLSLFSLLSNREFRKNSLDSLAITSIRKMNRVVQQRYSYVKRFIWFEIFTQTPIAFSEVTLKLSTQWQNKFSAHFFPSSFFSHLSNEHENKSFADKNASVRL